MSNEIFGFLFCIRVFCLQRQIFLAAAWVDCQTSFRNHLPQYQSKDLMKNYILIMSLLFSSLSAEEWITDAEQITEEFLTKTSSSSHYTEHVAHIKRVFRKLHINTFMEFGVGFSTKFFMDHVDKVISVEFVTPGTGPEWMKYCLDLYRDCKKWMPITYFSGKDLDTKWAPNKYMGVESVFKAAAYQPVNLKSYAFIDPSFLDDLTRFVDKQVAENKIDMAFVDCGICIRGYLVQVLFNKVPIIAAHDVSPLETRVLNDVYGYGRIQVPDNYIEIFISYGMGTSFWIENREEYAEIIQDLQKYSIPPSSDNNQKLKERL